jgi:hypothetical protein
MSTQGSSCRVGHWMDAIGLLDELPLESFKNITLFQTCLTATVTLRMF